MPTKNPRVHVVLEAPLFRGLKRLAKKNGLSLSLEARQLIREGLRFGGERRYKIYTGKHFSALIGKYRGGKTIDVDEELAKQVHG